MADAVSSAFGSCLDVDMGRRDGFGATTEREAISAQDIGFLGVAIDVDIGVTGGVLRRKWLWVTRIVLLEVLSTDLLEDLIYTFCLLQRMQQQSNISHVMRISHISHMRMCTIN